MKESVEQRLYAVGSWEDYQFISGPSILPLTIILIRAAVLFVTYHIFVN